MWSLKLSKSPIENPQRKKKPGTLTMSQVKDPLHRTDGVHVGSCRRSRAYIGWCLFAKSILEVYVEPLVHTASETWLTLGQGAFG